jgi:hypothetical protein
VFLDVCGSERMPHLLLPCSQNAVEEFLTEFTPSMKTMAECAWVSAGMGHFQDADDGGVHPIEVRDTLARALFLHVLNSVKHPVKDVAR